MSPEATTDPVKAHVYFVLNLKTG